MIKAVASNYQTSFDKRKENLGKQLENDTRSRKAFTLALELSYSSGSFKSNRIAVSSRVRLVTKTNMRWEAENLSPWRARTRLIQQQL